jgi:hypothetical protein
VTAPPELPSGRAQELGFDLHAGHTRRGRLVIAILVSVAAADWVSGTVLAVTGWKRRRLRLTSRLNRSTPTLSDEIEDWLRQQ